VCCDLVEVSRLQLAVGCGDGSVFFGFVLVFSCSVTCSAVFVCFQSPGFLVFVLRVRLGVLAAR